MKNRLKDFVFAGLAAGGVVLATAGLAAADGDRQMGYGKFGSASAFEGLDLDGDGKLTLEELAMRNAEMFTRHDANGDGLLSADELAAAIINERSQRANSMANRMVGNLDEDGDGMIGLDELDGKRRDGRIFDHLDDDSDGSISQEEFERFKDWRGRHGRKTSPGRKRQRN